MQLFKLYPTGEISATLFYKMLNVSLYHYCIWNVNDAYALFDTIANFKEEMQTIIIELILIRDFFFAL